ncbi:MAG: hypothetical protein GXO90_07170, partial [FCB group bacterium]|nr:hypothetical protein [FCB group bacterium]
TGKGIVATLVKHLTGLPVEFISADSLNYQNGFDIKLGDQITGQYGEVSAALLKEAGLKSSAPVFGITFYLDVLAPAIRRPKAYRPINSFPGIERDLNFVIDADQPAGDLEKMIRSRAGEWLKSVRIMDVFTHATLGAGKKSVLYRLYFQSHSKTLEDSEVNPIIDKIIKFAEKQFGAKLRS